MPLSYSIPLPITRTAATYPALNHATREQRQSNSDTDAVITALGIPLNSEIGQALKILAITRNRPEDERGLQNMGVNIIFHNGAEALDLIRRRHSQVIFGDMGDSKAHAQFISPENTLMVNQRYRGNFSKPALYAIAAAIYHEAGHLAGLGDDKTSLQEETDCLALNTMAYRAHVALDPSYGQSISTSPLLADGVALYPKLFFDADPKKSALVRRINEKYGDLPLSTPDHPVPFLASGQVPIAIRVWNYARLQEIKEYLESAQQKLNNFITPAYYRPVRNRTPFVPDLQAQWYYPKIETDPAANFSTSRPGFQASA